MRRLAAAALAALLLGGCVYYNGMYNTKRLAGSARRAERDGRPFEANNLWGQVINRADSLVIRHPHSKYVEEALVLKGLALARLDQCPSAVGPLSRAATLELERDIAEEAALALGHCQMELGDAGAAALAFGVVSGSSDPARRREARLSAAQTLRATGRAEEALTALEGIRDPRVTRERFLALAAAGRNDEALRVADSLIAVSDTARVWDSVITTVGQTNPHVASMLVDRLAKLPTTPPLLHTRRLVDDAARLEAVDTGRATARLEEAARQGGGTEPGDRAAMRLFRSRLSHAATTAELTPMLDSLRRWTIRSRVADEAQQLAATMSAVRSAADSAQPGAPQGDLRLFLAAESARDSLLAPALGASLFRRLVETWPDSPYAPKALLAGRALDPAWGDQVRGLLDERYSASPYVAFVRGEEPVGYRELEDSLQTYALSLAAAQVRRRPPAARGRDKVTPSAPQERQGRQPGQPPPNAPRRGLEP